MQNPTFAQRAAPHLLSLGRGSWQDYVYDGRPYFVYTPANYQVGRAIPLVMMVHGCLQSPSSFAYDTHMNQLADQQQFLVVYPQHATLDPGDVNPIMCWNFFYAVNQYRDSGEAGSLAGIVQEVLQKTSDWTIDRRRIYVAGVSSGAFIAVILGATYPDLFAAIGVHSGGEYQWAQLPSPLLQSQASAAVGQAQGPVAIEPPSDAQFLFHEGTLALATFGPGPDPLEQGQKAYEAMGSFARVMPTMVLHGTADAVAAPINGEQAVRQWLRTNQLASQVAFTATFEHPSSTTISPAGPQGEWPYIVFTWQDASAHDVLAYWRVEGMGHAWSGGSPGRPFTDPRGPNASLAMYQFFIAHALA